MKVKKTPTTISAVYALNFAESGHDEAWRDEVAKQLNGLLGRARVMDAAFARDVLAICERVQEFDEIRTTTS